MNNKLKETFDNIHAEEKLKEQTKVFIADKGPPNALSHQNHLSLEQTCGI